MRQFESEVAVPAVALAQARRLRSQREHQLATLSARSPFQIPTTRISRRSSRPSKSLIPLPATLLPCARRARGGTGYAASVARIGVAEASRFPTFSINGYYGTQSNTLDNLFISQTEVYQLQAGGFPSDLPQVAA